MSIRTPDQRIRVFVSSTLDELADERHAAREAIEGLRLTPVMFEQGARPHPPRALYRAYLEQSDIFIGLYWERYGWVAPGDEVSGLEDEYGLSGDRPKLIYIKSPAPNREPRLTALVDRIRGDDRVSYRRFGDANELRPLIADDVAVLLTERFAASAAGSEAPRSGTISQLPHPVTRLIGRDADVAGVLDLLADPDTRLVTIFGPGGMGKSRLALAIAELAKDRYPDGVAYVDLAPVSEPGLLLSTIARALGIEEQSGTTVSAQLRNRLADPRMLIVLDNMEQLIEAVGDLSDLLVNTHALQLLVTSRRVLDIRGERVFELEPLAVSADDGAVSAAVELFIDRARAIRPGFEPAEDDLAAFADLSRRLDGLPLAIELASARLRALSPRAVLERMGHQRLEFLGTGPRDLPSRQRTLRDTIAWSHSLLVADSKLLFARLSVFVGSADLEAIDGVTNPDGKVDTLELLGDLVDESLVHAVGDAAQPRFSMLETIREFAVDQLEASGEDAECRARHEAYYLAFAQRGDAALGSADQIEWLDRLRRENDNLRAVLRRAVRRDDAAGALLMGRALTNFWQMRGSSLEGRDWMEQVVSLPSAGPHDRAVAWTLGAVQSFLLGDFDTLERGLDDALRLANEPDDRRTSAFALLLRALASGATPDDEKWREAVTEASRRLEEEGEPLAVGFGLVAGSVLARIHGRADESQRLAQEALDLSKRIGESYVRVYAATQLARSDLGSGRRADARGHAIEALLAAQRLRNVNASSYALELWATADLGDGQIERAGRLYALAQRGYRQVGSEPWRTDAELHTQLDRDVHAALGDRYAGVEAEAGRADLDATIAELVRSEEPSHSASAP